MKTSNNTQSNLGKLNRVISTENIGSGTRSITIVTEFPFEILPEVNDRVIFYDEKISTFLPLPLDDKLWENMFVTFATKKGMVRKNKLIDVARSGKRELRDNGKLAIKLDAKDSLIGVKLCTRDDDILLSSSNGKCLRFPVEKLRLFSGLNSSGVKGIKLDKQFDCDFKST